MANETESVISVVLVPSGQLDGFYSLSSKIPNSLFHLDSEHVPHITIAQFIAPFSVIPRLEKEVEHIKRRIDVQMAGLNFVPDVKRDTTWVELLVLKTQELAELQSKVLDTQFAKDFSLQNWGTGDTYRPHITLGVLKGAGAIPQVSLGKLSEALRGSFSADVVVGKNGEHFSFAG